MCEVSDVMRKDEEYARGWVRLYEGKVPIEQAIEMAQYALDIQKLRTQHEKRCEVCEKDDAARRLLLGISR